MQRFDLLYQFHPVAPLESNIHYHKVRFQCRNGRQRSRSAVSLPANLQIRLLIDQAREPLTQNRMIIYQQQLPAASLRMPTSESDHGNFFKKGERLAAQARSIGEVLCGMKSLQMRSQVSSLADELFLRFNRRSTISLT